MKKLEKKNPLHLTPPPFPLPQKKQNIEMHTKENQKIPNFCG
jgi:hypothetical protein